MHWLALLMLIVLSLAFFAGIAVLAAISRRRQRVFTGEQLPAYQENLPSVHSRAAALDAYIAPLEYCEPATVKVLATERAWQLCHEGERLLHYVAQTRPFGFVNDICFEFDKISNQIYISCAARIGIGSVLGCHKRMRKNMESFRKTLLTRSGQNNRSSSGAKS